MASKQLVSSRIMFQMGVRVASVQCCSIVDVAFDQCVENIDIGGPSMLRSTAKNHAFTTIVTDPSQYDQLMAEINTTGGTSLALRKKLAAAAFALSASYDSAIASYFA